MTVADPPPTPTLTATEAVAMRDAYGTSAATWAQGPALIYRKLADLLVDHASTPLVGKLVIDLGAGTGVLSSALQNVGARPIGLDLAWGMLAHEPINRPPAVVGDAGKLPLRDDSVDGVGAAFSLTHVPDPDEAIREACRVTRPGGILLASSYHADSTHPAKDAVDGAAREFGFEVPDWHQALKRGTEPIFSSVDSVRELLQRCGFRDFDVVRKKVDVGIDDAATMINWRLGMASLSPFVASLSPDHRRELAERALDRLGANPVPYRPDVIFISAIVP